MKNTILDLKKKVLVVEVPEEASLVREKERIVVYLKMKKLFEMEGNFQFICKGSEITEEIASGIVEKFTEESGRFQDYQRPPCGYITALESFKSAIESKGFHWLENPIPEPELQGDETYCGYDEKWVDEWQQAEEKTFRNCLLFEIC